MKVIVVGKEVFSGTSKKNGQPYTVSTVHVTHAQRRCEGVAVQSLRIYSDFVSPDAIVVGMEYNADYDNNGRLINFELA